MKMRERRYDVFLNDTKAGTLVARDDHSAFVLDEAYADDPDRAVLGLRFEQDRDAVHRANMRLPPWFSNLLPEGRLRDFIAAQRGVSVEREMELLAEIGHDLPGAVRVLPAESDAHAVSRVREIVANGPHAKVDGMWRFSLAGVAMKFSLVGRQERFTAPAVDEVGDWIVKLPDPNHRDVPINEFVTMTLARCVGIDVPEVRLVHRDLIADVPAKFWPTHEVLAFAIRRFDREEGRRRVHMEDLAQVRGFYPEDKYNGAFETVAALIYRRHDRASLLEFVRRLAFNVVLRNGDAHLKNWTLLYRDPRIPTLSPAYDLVSTAPYDPGTSRPDDLGLRLAGTRRFESITCASFESLERTLMRREGLEGTVFLEEVERVVEGIRANWPTVREEAARAPWLLKALDEVVAGGIRSILTRG